MASTSITVTVPNELLAEAEAAVCAARGLSVTPANAKTALAQILEGYIASYRTQKLIAEQTMPAGIE